MNTYTLKTRLRVLTKMFSSDEQGSMTVWGLFVWFVSGILGALALDVTHLIASRTHLQVAADQAAHAAIYQRYLMDEDTETLDDVRDKALALVSATLPSGRYGITMERADIEFGHFNLFTRTWTTDETAEHAVRAVARFSRDRNSAATSFLFRLIGIDDFNVAAQSIFIAYGKSCLSEGYVAEDVVDIQSNNSFEGNFCLHSNTHVSVNQNNFFGPNTVVSMPDPNNLDIPGGIKYDLESGQVSEEDLDKLDKNDGLADVLISGEIYLDPVLNRVENMIYHYEHYMGQGNVDGTYPNEISKNSLDYWPPFMDGVNDMFLVPKVISAPNNGNVTTADIISAGTREPDYEDGTDDAGNPIRVPVVGTESDGTKRVYLINCKGNSGLTIDASAQPLENMIIVSPCEIKFSNGSQIANARIVTTSTSADSISATSGMVLGLTGSCDDGVQLLTLGGVRFPADLTVNGSQIIALGDIQFAAGADGMLGASFISGGMIDGTSNGAVTDCNTGMLGNVVVKYFRMVR